MFKPPSLTLPKRCLWACLITAGLAVAPAAAEEAMSPWAEGYRSAVRIVSAGIDGDGRYRAGLEIHLAPGFKTYWRTPGDSGVPPVFGWSRSDNVAAVEVLWPVPARFADGAGTSIGYKSDVLLPLTVRPRDPAKPVRLALDLRYAVCDNICIPAHAELAFALPRAAVATSGGRLGAAWARIPTVVVAPSADAPVVKSLVAQRSDGRAEVRVAIGAPQGTIIDDIFAEAPEPWLFGTPAIATVATGEIVARIPVDDSPSGEAPANLPLVLTLTGPAGAFEIKADLDARPLAR